ncbi:MAG: hypothetical protein V1725_00005 [archaeon]
MVDTSYLGKLRVYRGRDEAVEIIGDRSNLTSLLENSVNHKRNEIIEAVISSYSGSAYGDANWTKVISARGDSPERTTIHGIFAQQNPHLAQLNLDQGVVTHLPEFVDFLKSQDQSDYLAARESFKKYLGSKTVWRGMVLSDEEAEKMRHEGIESDFLRKSGEMSSTIENFEANLLSVYFDEVVERHFHGENYWSPLVSVSSHQDVAIAVGRHFGGRTLTEEGKNLHLFKIQIPEIDLIYYTEHAARLPGKLQDSVRNGTHLHVSVNGTESSFPWDKHTESYVMYKINPDEIIDVLKPELSTTSWNGKVSQ